MTFTVNAIDTAPVATISAVARDFSELELQLAVLLDCGITTVVRAQYVHVLPAQLTHTAAL